MTLHQTPRTELAYFAFNPLRGRFDLSFTSEEFGGTHVGDNPRTGNREEAFEYGPVFLGPSRASQEELSVLARAR